MTEFLGYQANPYANGYAIEKTPESVGTELIVTVFVPIDDLPR